MFKSQNEEGRDKVGAWDQHIHTTKCGLSRWLRGKESAYDAGVSQDGGSIPGWGRSPGGGQGNPLQYSGLENPMDRGTWQLQFIGSQRVGHE